MSESSGGVCTLYDGGVLHATLILDLRTVEWDSTRISANDRLHHHALHKRTQLWQQLAAKAGHS